MIYVYILIYIYIFNPRIYIQYEEERSKKNAIVKTNKKQHIYSYMMHSLCLFCTRQKLLERPI